MLRFVSSRTQTPVSTIHFRSSTDISSILKIETHKENLRPSKYLKHQKISESQLFRKVLVALWRIYSDDNIATSI